MEEEEELPCLQRTCASVIGKKEGVEDTKNEEGGAPVPL